MKMYPSTERVSIQYKKQYVCIYACLHFLLHVTSDYKQDIDKEKRLKDIHLMQGLHFGWAHIGSLALLEWVAAQHSLPTLGSFL